MPKVNSKKSVRQITKSTNHQKGFTLFEAMISLGLIAMITFSAYYFIVLGYKTNALGTEQETAVSNARHAQEIMSREIREAIQSDRGDYALGALGAQDFSFYSNIDEDSDIEFVRFYLDGSEIKKTITEPGSPPTYSTPGNPIVIAQYVNNQAEAIFEYYNGDNNQVANINEVRLIKINLKINVTPERAPADYYVQTDVNLRNLKDNL